MKGFIPAVVLVKPLSKDQNGKSGVPATQGDLKTVMMVKTEERWI